jgi:kinesin family protein 2/24
LRYSDRLKEKTKAHFGGNYNNMAGRGLNAGEGGSKKSGNNENNNVEIEDDMNMNDDNDNGDNNNNDNDDDVEMNDDTDNNNAKNNNNNNVKNNNNNNVKNNKNNNNNNNIKSNNNNNKPNKSKPTSGKIKNNNNNNNNNNNMDLDDTPSTNNDDWNYLKKTAKLEGKELNDNYIRYHQLTDKLVEDEDDIINTHMNVIKEDAKYLNEEGNLITNIKGVGTEEDFQMDEYVEGLEKIIAGKLKIYGDLQKKIDRYKKHIKEEDELRQTIDPELFDDDL